MSNQPNTDPILEATREWKSERPELGDLTAMAVFGRISRLVSRQRSIFNDRHEAAGLSLGAFDVLANLRRAGRNAEKTPGQLASTSFLGLVSLGGVSLRLDKLEKDGLVVRRRSTTDRRVVLVSLTAYGWEFVESVHAKHVETQELLLSRLSPEEKSVLNELLCKAEESMMEWAGAAREIPVYY